MSPDEVIRDFAPRVYRVARRLLGTDSDAEDVTQDVLMTVVKKLTSFRGESSLGTWLHRITVNAALAYRRKRARRAEREVPDPLADFSGDGQHAQLVRHWSSPPEQELLKRETSQLIEAAIAELPDMYRDVYVLADIEGLPNAEIAELLGLNVAGVKSRLHRARLMMRQALAPHFEETAA